MTEFTASGAAIAQSNAQAATGTYSLLVNPANAAVGEGFYYTTPSLVGHPEGSVLTASVEVRGASASGNVKLSIQDSSGVELLATATHNLTAGFVRLSLQHNITRPPASYRMSVIRGLRLKNDHASINVYVAFDQTASATTGFVIAPGEVFETSWPIDFRTKISAVAASGTPAIHGVVWGIHQG